MNGSPCARWKASIGSQVDVAEVVGVDDDDFVGAVGQVGVGGDRARPSRATRARTTRPSRSRPEPLTPSTYARTCSAWAWVLTRASRTPASARRSTQ